MGSVDQWIAELGSGGLGLAVAVALLLGARHATDPDHLTAVSAIILSDDRRGGRRAGLLGLSWGLGHATTLFLFGLPVVLFGRSLPPRFQQGAEALVGLLIIGLAIRLLVRWRNGSFHSHAHRHGVVSHTHPHVHEQRDHGLHRVAHTHRHAEGLGRSPLAAFGIGLVHGAGGSAAVGILLVAAAGGRVDAAIGLFLFAIATAVSMALVSAAVGYALVRGVVAPRLERAIPAFATLSLVFGIWYTLNAFGLPQQAW
jgi:ABC-type nickel/cobalt efflux system permease component RcnA